MATDIVKGPNLIVGAGDNDRVLTELHRQERGGARVSELFGRPDRDPMV